MIHLGFDVPCSNQLIVSPLFRGNSPYPYRSLTYRTNAEYHIKSRFVKQNFPPMERRRGPAEAGRNPMLPGGRRRVQRPKEIKS